MLSIKNQYQEKYWEPNFTSNVCSNTFNWLWYKNCFNPFIPNSSFLYPLKTMFCFQGVEKGCIGNEWVNMEHFLYHIWIDVFRGAFRTLSNIYKTELFAKAVKGYKNVESFCKRFYHRCLRRITDTAMKFCIKGFFS